MSRRVCFDQHEGTARPVHSRSPPGLHDILQLLRDIVILANVVLGWHNDNERILMLVGMRWPLRIRSEYVTSTIVVHKVDNRAS
jgi:hypothetical protein